MSGYCIEGDRCVCCGDTPRVRAGCGNWREVSPKRRGEFFDYGLSPRPTEHDPARDPRQIIAEAEDVAAWIERTNPQGLLYDSAMPTLREAAATITRLAGQQMDLELEKSSAVVRLSLLRKDYAALEAERDALLPQVQKARNFITSRSDLGYGDDPVGFIIAQLSAANARADAAEAAVASVIVAESGIIVGQSQPLEFIKARAALRSDQGRRDIIQGNPNE